MQNVATGDSFSIILDELRRHAEQPLRLYASPLVPKSPPVTLDLITSYIQAHYQPGPVISSGKLRVWYSLTTTPPRPSPE
jgi:hypothetical protein